MASLQHGAGSGKSSKFTLENPIANSTGDGDGAEQSIQQAVQENVDKRMNQAINDLRKKYSQSGEGFDAANDNQPTGTAYARERAAAANHRAQLDVQESAHNAMLRREEDELRRQLQASKLADASDDEDDEYLAELENDPELEALRRKRLLELRSAHKEKAENLAKGHGQYREITQDEFISEVTGSCHCVCHFYHRDFERCKIMDMHLGRLARQHIECKFVKINAEKTPFFVQKLQVKMLPVLIIFLNGISTSRINGFDGLNDNAEPGKEDEWPTENLAKKLALVKAINYSYNDKPDEEQGSSIRFGRGGFHSNADDDEEFL